MINNQMQQYQLPNITGTEEIRALNIIPKKRCWNPKSKKNVSSDNLSFAEEAKLEMAVTPSKTPITILQELLSRRGTSPKYELVQIEGAIHEPTFRYQVAFADTIGCPRGERPNGNELAFEFGVKLEEWGSLFSELFLFLNGEPEASGTGRSKKRAKHAAAKNILDKLIGNPVMEEITMNGMTNGSNQMLRSYDDKIPGNPIGTLQEMCMAMRWPPPTYEMTGEEGPPHERQFTIACVLLKYREVGIGKSKKLAKRQAANKMWEKLQDCPLDFASMNCTPEMGHRVGSASTRYADLKNSKISTLTTPHSHKVSEFHKNLKQSTGVKLSELHTNSFLGTDFNFVDFLQDIATEQQFEVTYVDIEERSLTGESQCLVQLSTFPVAVCHGTGATPKEAQSSAALNALEYLRIMTKK